MKNYKKMYTEALERAKKLYEQGTITESLGFVFPEFTENGDEKIKKEIIAIFKGKIPYTSEEDAKRYIAWLEKQDKNKSDFSNIRIWKYIVATVLTEENGIGQYLDNPDTERIAKKLQEIYGNIEKQGEQSTEPKWCHHKVDLSDCSEEYRKAYYDGWNNCNMQHSQCKDEATMRMRRCGYNDGYKHGQEDITKSLSIGKNINHTDIKEKARQIAWEMSKDYDPSLSKEAWCEMAALDMAFWLKREVDDAYLQGICDAKNEIEKQTENKQESVQKPFDYEHATIHQKDFAPKDEPKFKVGDWVILNGTVAQILDKQKYGFVGLDIDGKDFFCNHGHSDSMHLWTISDAENGDVLVASDESIFIYDGSTDKYAKFYVGLTKYGTFNFEGGNWDDKNSVHPSTKKQRDFLFQKMAKAGYEWDAEKKELKKIEPKTLDPDKVIEWLVANICEFDYYVKLFKKDFEL